MRGKRSSRRVFDIEDVDFRPSWKRNMDEFVDLEQFSRQELIGTTLPEVVKPDIRAGTTKMSVEEKEDELLDEIATKIVPRKKAKQTGYLDMSTKVPSFREWKYRTKPSESQKEYKAYLEAIGPALAQKRIENAWRGKRSYRRRYGGYRRYRRPYRRYGGYRRRYNRYRSGYGAYYDPDTDSWQKGFAPNYGSRIGSALGEGIQSFAEVIGLGDYKVKKNSLMANINMGTDPPTVKNSMRGEATIIHHREYLGDLMTGAGSVSPFQLQTYQLNIGNSLLFPFGSALAKNFQEWEPRGIIVELKSISSEYAANLALGSMFMAVDYNSLDDPPVNKTELENLEYAVSQKPSKSCMMPVECAMVNDVLTHLYVSLDGEYQGGDPRFSDLGKLYIGSYGVPNTGGLSSPIAEIWISYEIALFKPHIHGNLNYPSTAPYTHLLLEGVDPATPFGYSDWAFDVNQLGMTNNQTSMRFPVVPVKRTYYVTWVCKLATAVSLTSWGATTYPGCTVLAQFINETGTALGTTDRTITGVAGQRQLYRKWMFEVAANAIASIDWPDAGWVSTPTVTEAKGEIFIFLASGERVDI